MKNWDPSSKDSMNFYCLQCGYSHQIDELSSARCKNCGADTEFVSRIGTLSRDGRLHPFGKAEDFGSMGRAEASAGDRADCSCK